MMIESLESKIKDREETIIMNHEAKQNADKAGDGMSAEIMKQKMEFLVM